jgi:polyphosphate kinase
MEKNILAISGNPGLYLLVSRGRATLIVETVDEQKKRLSVSIRDKITSLNDISIFTDDEDVLLTTVLESIKKKMEGKPVEMITKKASKKELTDFLASVLPNFDRDRVYPNDIRKIINWYNILINNGYTDFETKEVQNESSEETAEKPEETA